MQVTLGEEGSGFSEAVVALFLVKKGERRKAALGRRRRRKKEEGRRSDLESESFMEERERESGSERWLRCRLQ